MQKKTIIRSAALAATLLAAPLAFSPGQGVTENQACGQKVPGTGTCCYQENAICITPTGNIGNAYYKSEGRC